MEISYRMKSEISRKEVNEMNHTKYVKKCKEGKLLNILHICMFHSRQSQVVIITCQRYFFSLLSPFLNLNHVKNISLE